MSRLEIPHFYLEADVEANLPNITKVISLDSFEFYLYIHLPEELSRKLDIYEVSYKVKDSWESIDTTEFMQRDSYHPWIQFISGIFHKEVGQHVYKISMIDTTTMNTCVLYFSYIIQSDNPDKPYVYVDGNCQCGGSYK